MSHPTNFGVSFAYTLEEGGAELIGVHYTDATDFVCTETIVADLLAMLPPAEDIMSMAVLINPEQYAGQQTGLVRELSNRLGFEDE